MSDDVVGRNQELADRISFALASLANEIQGGQFTGGTGIFFHDKVLSRIHKIFDSELDIFLRVNKEAKP